MQEAVFEEMEVYVLKKHNKVAQYITMQPIMYLCEETVGVPVMWVAKSWWYLEVMDLAGARATEAASED